MRIIFLILVNIFLLTLSETIIRDLHYNNYHTEDMNNYENKFIPEGTKFFIRFPYNSENEMKFYIILFKNMTLFSIYNSEFSEYPDDATIKSRNFINKIVLNKQEIENTQYIKYSFNIHKTRSYQVIYFQNDEILNYISFYAYSFAANTFSNMPMNQSLSIFSLKKDSSYFLKFNTSEGKRFQIETSASLSYLPDYELDIKCFPYEPSEYEMTKIDESWKKNLTYKLSDDNYKEYRMYEYESKENHQFFIIHIYNKNLLNELSIRIEMIEEDYQLPIWAIILIAICAIALIIGILCLIKRACCNNTDIKNNDNTAGLERAKDFCCVMLLCGYCLASVAESGKLDNKIRYDP